MKNVLVPLAQGFEEAEFIGIVDVLRRAGLNVIIAGLDSAGNVKGANNVEMRADVALKDVDVSSLDSIVLPGGYDGADNLANNANILSIIKDLHTKGKLVAAMMDDGKEIKYKDLIGALAFLSLINPVFGPMTREGKVLDPMLKGYDDSIWDMLRAVVTMRASPDMRAYADRYN